MHETVITPCTPIRLDLVLGAKVKMGLQPPRLNRHMAAAPVMMDTDAEPAGGHGKLIAHHGVDGLDSPSSVHGEAADEPVGHLVQMNSASLVIASYPTGSKASGLQLQADDEATGEEEADAGGVDVVALLPVFRGGSRHVWLCV